MSARQLELLKQLAHERRDQAKQALSEGQARVQQAEGQLKQLAQYERDYHALAGGEGKSAMVANQLVASRRFLLDIQAAVAAQEQPLTPATDLVNRLRVAWAESERYATAIEKLAKTRAQAARQEVERKEQQQLDQQYGLRRFFAAHT